MKSNITGIILAGGKSSRMGKDKSFVLFSGRPLIEIVIDTLSSLFEELIVVTNNIQPYQKYGIKIQTDILKDKGPLGGIHAGLVSSGSRYNFIVACDMPFLNKDLIRYMAEKANGYDAVIADTKENPQPLCAVYSRDCIQPIEKELSKNNLKVRDFLRYVNVRVISEDEISRFDPGRLSFVNINTPEESMKFDYKRKEKKE